MSVPTARQILLSIPSRFRPEKALNYHTLFHFDITGEHGGQFTVHIKDGQCKLSEGLHGEASCVVWATDEVYVALETGRMNPHMALMLGKIKVSNMAEMIQFVRCFRRYDRSSQVEEPNAQRSGASAVPTSRQRPEKIGPLKGLRVLDFTRLLPGPLATQMMAEMGAEVFKIEDPDAPDYIRHFLPVVEGQSAYYLALNRSKKSIAIHYSTEAGRKIIYELVKTADLLIEQFRPGVMNQWGLGYDTLKHINPRLVYVSITGYGQNGPMAQEAGHDLNYIAMSGLLSITGLPYTPVIPGGQIADIAAGSYMAIAGALTALYAREKSGHGQHVDVAMTDAVLPIITLQYARFKAEKQLLPAGTFELSGGLANYNVYQCADGKWVALGALEPKFWNNFCDMVQQPDWKEKILLPHHAMQTFRHTVAELFMKKTRQEWLEMAQGKEVCLTPVLHLDELEHHPHHVYRNNFSDAYFGAIHQPLRFSSFEKTIFWNAPSLGEDNDELHKIIS